MNRFRTFFAALALCLACLLPTQAIPGVSALRKPVLEALEVIVKAASRESSDAAASRVARELAEKLGRDLPEVAAMSARYGDDLGVVLRNGTRAKLYSMLGDDAAQAFIRNGQAAENALANVPAPEMAQLLRRVSREDARRLSELTRRGQISPGDCADWCKLIRERGSAVLAYAVAHPGMSLASMVALDVAAKNPERVKKVLAFLYEAGEFVWAHPVLSAIILLVVLALCSWCVSWLVRSPVSIFRWVGKKLGRAGWAKLLCRRRRREVP